MTLKKSGQTSPPTPPCALLFFGLPKSFRNLVLPSILQNIVAPNPTCHIFLHSYNISTISSSRNGENDAPLVISDVYLLTENVTLSAVGDFYKEVDVEKYHPYNPVSLGWEKECCQSMENMLKQWYSIRGAWELMEQSEPEFRKYERVGLFRSDVIYTHPISIFTSTNRDRQQELKESPAQQQQAQKQQRPLSDNKHNFDEAVVPSFLVYKALPWMNDRMFYGTRSYAQVWATHRFPFLDEQSYLTTNWIGRKVGLHSETFLKQLMDDREVPFVQKDICFWRARANGNIKFSDCNVPCDYGWASIVMCPIHRWRVKTRVRFLHSTSRLFSLWITGIVIAFLCASYLFLWKRRLRQKNRHCLYNAIRYKSERKEW